ncbi:MAG: hypothetical protein L6Q99_14805 [Planctomycetes bacterium]|nr:hypothetical protein [Planctomycetota bacterium]
MFVGIASALLVLVGGMSEPSRHVDPPHQEGPGVPERRQEEPAPKVALVLVASTTRLTPGGEFELAARFVIPPGQHIHWTNPGTGATRTNVELTLPDGFEVDGPFFAGPERFDEGNGTVHYGWEKEALVLWRVRTPAELTEDTHYTFAASARWLAHGTTRVMGEAAKKLRLEPIAAGAPAAPNEPKLFARARDRLPRPWKELEGARVEWSASKDGTKLVALFRVEHGDRLDFFPDATSAFDVAGRRLFAEREFAGAVVELVPREGAPEKDRKLSGLLSVERDGARRWYQVELAR